MWTAASSRLLAIVTGVLLLVCGLAALGRSAPAAPDPATLLSGLRASAPARPPASPVPTIRSLYADDFHADALGANPPAGWQMTGAWQGVTEDGGDHVLTHSPGNRLGMLLTGSPAWSSYQVTADVKVLTPKAGFAGLVGRFQSSGDYYECVVHHDESVLLWRLRGGQGVQLGGTQRPIDVTKFHRLALSLEGDRLTCSLDSVTMATSVDGALAMGRPGLIASSGEAAEFDRVAVTAGRSPPPATAPATAAATPPAPTDRPSAPAPSPAASPAPAATPQSPSPPSGPPAILRAPQQVARGTSTTMAVRTTPGAACALALGNPVAATNALGLGVVTADAQGTASWTWRVGAGTPPGAVPVTITCGGTVVQTAVTVV